MLYEVITDVSTGLRDAFTDVEGYFGRCRFSDCSHISEPGCAIKEAIQNGELLQERWNSYLDIMREAKFVDDKAGFLRDKTARDKSIAQFSRQNKKNVWRNWNKHN